MYVVCISGHNLGLNSMLGFVESFVASHCCRICTANKQQLQSMLFQNDDLLRTMDKYDEALLISNPSKTGIKDKCVFVNALHGFQLFNHVAVDILHDFFEGCCSYVMSYIINFLVLESNLIPLNILKSK